MSRLCSLLLTVCSQHWIGKICCFWDNGDGEYYCSVRWMVQPDFTVVKKGSVVLFCLVLFDSFSISRSHPAEIYASIQYCHDCNIKV